MTEKLNGLHMQKLQCMSQMSLCQPTTKATIADVDNQHLKRYRVECGAILSADDAILSGDDAICYSRIILAVK